MRATVAAILLLATCTWDGGGYSEARCELQYKPHFIAGRACQPLPRSRRVWFWQGNSIGVVDGTPDGPDAVILADGTRLEIDEQGRAR